MPLNERNQADQQDRRDQAEHSDGQEPEIFMMLFGEGAGAAWVTAGERMRRWAAAFDDWRQERKETHHKTAACNDKLAWGEFLGLVKKAPWEVDWRDMQVYVDHSLEEGMTPGTLTNRLTSLSKFYDFVQEWGIDLPG